MSDKKFEISRKTKSRAYQFIKSLMKDDIDPTKIHNLMDAIREHVDKDVAGEILFDLLKNPKDLDGGVKRHTTWFGPISVSYWHHVFELLTEHLEEEDLKGWARFGDKHDWDEWNSTVTDSLSESDLKKARDNCQSQLIYFEYWADGSQHRITRRFISDLYKRIKDSKKKKNA